MAHNLDTGRIFVSGNVGINTDDVAAVLGVGSNDVGTLCRHDRINKAALFRPRYTQDPGLELNAAGFTAIATQVSQRPDSSYECPAYGVWVPKFPLNSQTGATLMGNVFQAARKEWYIAAPSGNSFNCLTHFAGYDDKAKVQNPINTATVSKRSAGGYTISVQLTTPAPDGSTLSVSNLFGTASNASKRWYFGLVVFRGTDPAGWKSTDVMLVQGTGIAISNDSATRTTQTVTINDTGADNTKEYWYRIIPFVCDRANVTASTLSDTTFYGLKMDAECYQFLEKKSTAGGTTTNPNTAYMQFFNYKDANNGEYYPYPGRLDLKWPSGVYTPDIAIAYSEIPEAEYVKSSTNKLPYFNSLLNKYHRIDFVFSVYASGGKPDHIACTYTWRKSGSDPDDNLITRDTQRDNNGSFPNELFFYIPQGNFWTDIARMVGSSSISISDMYGEFYYRDSNGVERSHSHFATEIFDDSQS